MVLTYNVEKDLKPTTDFLSKTLRIANTGQEKVFALYAWPDSAKRLEKAVKHLRKVGYTVKELAKEPILLSYDFDQRILPRSAWMMAEGKIPPRPPIDTLTAISDSDFCMGQGVGTTQYLKFKKLLQIQTLADRKKKGEEAIPVPPLKQSG